VIWFFSWHFWDLHQRHLPLRKANEQGIVPLEGNKIALVDHHRHQHRTLWNIGLNSMIEGVLLHPLSQIPDERGRIMHMLRADEPHFERFGEIYFSMVYPGVVKGWHLHREMTLNYAVVVGTVKLVLFDDRPGSPTRGEIMELFLGESNYCLAKIPPMIWNGFKGIGIVPAIVANCATIPYNNDEVIRLDPSENSIPYNWDIKNR
jgi:dTDP-4-dehydrorhamnose 3,5-epimerase